MTRHEDFNVPKVDKKKVFLKILLVLIVPIYIIIFPFFYDQGLELENVLTALVVLFALVYVGFFIIGR